MLSFSSMCSWLVACYQWVAIYYNKVGSRNGMVKATSAITKQCRQLRRSMAFGIDPQVMVNSWRKCAYKQKEASSNPTHRYQLPPRTHSHIATITLFRVQPVPRDVEEAPPRCHRPPRHDPQCHTLNYDTICSNNSCDGSQQRWGYSTAIVLRYLLTKKNFTRWRQMANMTMSDHRAMWEPRQIS